MNRREKSKAVAQGKGPCGAAETPFTAVMVVSFVLLGLAAAQAVGS